MLTELSIADFAIVERLEIDLRDGLTVMTGETGAGKSILVDALGLAIGERSSVPVVRPGAERADISAVFDVAECPEVSQWLEAQDLHDGEAECIVRRTIGTDGRSRAFINARPVPIQRLRELGDMLVDVHGQHAHQSLVRGTDQRRILDAYAAHEKRLAAVRESAQRSKEIRSEIARLSGAYAATPADRDARIELLAYQHGELTALKPETGEVEHLHGEQRQLSHGARLVTVTQEVAARIAEDDQGSALSQVSRALRALEELLGYDPGVQEAYGLLDTAMIHLQEASSSLQQYMDRLELSPERLQEVEARLAALHDVARKHHVQPEALPDLLLSLDKELATLRGAEARLQSLEEELRRNAEAYRTRAAALTKSRRQAATKLANAVAANMHRLGMPGGRFEIRVDEDTDREPSANGADSIQFLVSVNPGQPLQPLGQVASGGELSRIALAVQVIAAEDAAVPTLIFDEVDAGIGGAVAEIVGDNLRALGQNRQVLCITHLPQVAAQGQHHLQIRKTTAKESTTTRLESLEGERRVEEIARMLGGVEITPQSLAHAREMLDRKLR